MTRYSLIRICVIIFCAALPASVWANANEAGRNLFNEGAVPACALCHTLTDAGSEGEIGPNLDEFKPTFEQVRAAVTSGIGVMPAYEETMSADEIEAVARYVSDAAGAGAAQEASAPAGATEEKAGTTAVVAGDPVAGAKVFMKCKACHSVEKGGPNRAGPNLFGIVGASVAAVEGFKYSPAMKAYGGEWTVERLDAFLTSPRKEVPKTKMSFGGLRKEKERADLIAYMASLTD